MRTWLQQHVASLGATLRRLARAPLTTLLSALAIGASLALPLGAYVLLDNLQRVADRFRGDPQLTVYLHADASKADAQALESLLKGADAVRDFRWVSRDEALAELKKTEVGELLALLDGNPLPDAYVVNLRTDALAGGLSLAEELEKRPGVAQVQLDTVWVNRLDAALRAGRVVVVVLATILGIGLAAVTFNTVRMQILQRRDEYEVAKLVGATDAWVRRPFYYQGALLGLLGAAMAILLLGASGAWLNRELEALGASYGVALQLAFPAWADLLAVAGFAAGLGWLGAHFSVSRHLLSR